MEKNAIIKIAVIGAESTGKSSLVKDLAAHFKTSYVSEYAREYFNHHDIDNYSIEVFDTIYRTQLVKEEEASGKANRFLFCDTTLITGKIWSEEVFGEVALFIKENIHNAKYDLYLVTANDVPWEKDNQRKNPHNRAELLQKNIDELVALNANFVLIEGLKEQRLKNAIEIINKFFGKN